MKYNVKNLSYIRKETMSDEKLKGQLTSLSLLLLIPSVSKSGNEELLNVNCGEINIEKPQLEN